MKFLNIKSGLYKKVLGFFGAAGFLVTFQACYGTPQNYVEINGCVKDSETESGISNLQISVYSEQDSVVVLTDENGRFWNSIFAEGNINVRIVDIDNENNGVYREYDTVLIRESSQEYYNLEIELNNFKNDLNIEM